MAAGRDKGTGVTLSRERSFLVIAGLHFESGFPRLGHRSDDPALDHRGAEDSGMPAFGRGRLSDAQIRDLVAYVRTFEHRDKPAATLGAQERPTHIHESPYDFETTPEEREEASLAGANFRIFFPIVIGSRD